MADFPVREVTVALGNLCGKVQKYFIGYYGENNATKLCFTLPQCSNEWELTLYFTLADGSTYVAVPQENTMLLPSGLVNGEQVVLTAQLERGKDVFLSQQVILYSSGSVKKDVLLQLTGLSPVSVIPVRTSQLLNDSSFATVPQVNTALNQKADSLRLTDNTLQLTVGNQPIGSPVAIPTGGSTDVPYKLIADITLTEAVGSVVISKDTNGNAFSLTDVLITSSTKSTNTTNYYVVSVNGRNIYAGQDQNNIFYNRNIRLNRVSVDTDVANSYTYNYQYTRYTNVLNPNAIYGAKQSLNADKIAKLTLYLNASDTFTAGSSFRVWGR